MNARRRTVPGAAFAAGAGSLSVASGGPWGFSRRVIALAKQWVPWEPPFLLCYCRDIWLTVSKTNATTVRSRFVSGYGARCSRMGHILRRDAWFGPDDRMVSRLRTGSTPLPS